MKNIVTACLLTLLLLILPMLTVLAQPSEKNIPTSFTSGTKLPEPDVLTISAPSLEKYSTAYDGKNGTYVETGISLAVNAGIDDAGTWTDMPDGSRIWRLTLNAPGATALAVIYDRFALPEGGKLWLYNAYKTQVVGAFNSKNNPAN